jgi:lipoate-protein ligase A
VNARHPQAWDWLDSGPGAPAWNMAVDEMLLVTSPERGRPVLRFYSWNEPAATFGYFQKFHEVEKLTLLRPLIRRTTGGGIVPHDADWTYSVAFPPGTEWYGLVAIESYRRIHDWVRQAFAKMGVTTELAQESRRALPGQCFVGHEQFDVLWQGRKIAGAAQRRTRDGLLIQGSVQPPPLGLQRGDWHAAMREVAQEQGAAWHEFNFSIGRKERAEELARHYAAPEHNQRR